MPSKQSQILSPDFSHDPPPSLKNQPIWLLWKYERGKKIPIDPVKTNLDGIPLRCKWSDPASLVSFLVARERFTKLDGYCDGIAFVIPEDLVGIDLDDGFPHSDELISKCNSYCEMSPSGKGYHMLICGKYSGGNRNGPAEIYGQGSPRLFTYTGRSGNQNEIQSDQQFVDDFASKYIEAGTSKADSKQRPVSASSGPKTSRLVQAQRYLEKCPGSVQGENASDYCFAISMALIHGFQLERDVAVDLLVNWGHKASNRCSSGEYNPWSETEIKHKIDSAAKTVYRGTPGDRLEQPGMKTENYPLADDYRASANPKSLFVDWDELQAIETQTDADWFVPKWLEFGSLGMLTGAPFSGKSHLVSEIIGCMACDRPWAGLKLNKVPCLLIDLENRYRILRKRLRNSVTDPNHDLQSVLNVIRKEKLKDLLPLDPQKIQDLISQFHQYTKSDKSLVVIDTMRSAFNESDLDMDQMRKLLYPLQRVAQETNSALLLLHHRPKNKAKYSGAASIPGALDFMWVWEHDEHGNGKLSLEGTRDDPQSDLRFQFNNQTQCNVFVESVAGSGSNENSFSKLQVIKPLFEGNLSATSHEITQKLSEYNLSKSRVSQMKKSWREQGWVTTEGTQGKAQKFLLTSKGRTALGLV